MNKLSAIAMVALLAGCASSTTTATNVQIPSHRATAPKRTARAYHGWVIAPYHSLDGSYTSQEVYSSPKAICDGSEILANRMYDAQQSGQDMDSVSTDVPGKFNLNAGTTVDVTGHESYPCGSVTFDLTDIRVTDAGSSLNGKSLVMISGKLAKK